jgi:FG-GAP repeat
VPLARAVAVAFAFAAWIVACGCVVRRAEGAVGEVRAFSKISATQGNFRGRLADDDYFGGSVAALGDLDGDATPDVAVGALYDDDGGPDRGAVYVLFLHSNGTVKAEQKISATQGNLQGVPDGGAYFGGSVAGLGDIDGDATLDLAVGAHGDNDGGPQHGAVYILFLHRNGTVKTEQKISDTEGNFQGQLADRDLFGIALAALGDLDGDAIPDLAIGALESGLIGPGAVYVLFLRSNGTAKAEQKISNNVGNLQTVLPNGDQFGCSATAVGDLDGDATTELVVGSDLDDDGGAARGAVYVLFLHRNGTVKRQQKISDTQGNLQGVLEDFTLFGYSVTALGDLDGDATQDVAVGTLEQGRGAVYILFLNPNGTVKAEQEISDTEGNFNGVLDTGDRFGIGVTSLGDLDGDLAPDLVVGAFTDDDGGTNRGAVYVLFLEGVVSTTAGHNALTTGSVSFSSSGAPSTSSDASTLGFSTTGTLSLAVPSPSLSPSGVEVSGDVAFGSNTAIIGVVAGSIAAVCLVAVIVVILVQRQRQGGPVTSAVDGSATEYQLATREHEEDTVAYHNCNVIEAGAGDSAETGEHPNRKSGAGESAVNVGEDQNRTSAGEYHNLQLGENATEACEYHNVP